MMLTDAFLGLLAPMKLMIVLFGVFIGIIVGVLPGITAGMLMALTLPFTFAMQPTDAVALLIAMFVGGASGGLITATLMRMPGEPNAVMTCMDGYPLARSGHPGRALGLGNAASIVGGAISWLALVLLSGPLSRVGVYFGPWETFTLVAMALTLISSLSGKSIIKGLIAGLLGMLMSFPGIDESSGIKRLTFGQNWLDAGLDVLPVMIGLFAISQIIADIVDGEEDRCDVVRASMHGIFLSLRDYVTHGWNMLRSSLIGVGIGILPGVGATIASIVAYMTAKKASKEPERFGKGSEEAIVAAESANNATTGGTLIPLLSLGVPAGLADTILLSALIIHNLQPGPMLYVSNPEIVNTIMATHLFAHVVMFFMMIGGTYVFARMMLLSRAWIYPAVLVISIIGAFALNGRMSDVWIMLAFGVVGFLLERAGAPLAPFVIGFILQPLAERDLRTALMASGGSWSEIFDRPVALAFAGIAVLAIAIPLFKGLILKGTTQEQSSS
jgi:putative tricarboxylic transport membrane protein